MDDFNFEKEENQIIKRNVDEFIQNLSENIIMNQVLKISYCVIKIAISIKQSYC